MKNCVNCNTKFNPRKRYYQRCSICERNKRNQEQEREIIEREQWRINQREKKEYVKSLPFHNELLKELNNHFLNKISLVVISYLNNYSIASLRLTKEYNEIKKEYDEVFNNHQYYLETLNQLNHYMINDLSNIVCSYVCKESDFENVFDVELKDGNLYHWIIPRKGSIYENKKFNIIVEIPDYYPFVPLITKIDPPLYHPAVYPTTGVIIVCNDNTFMPIYTILSFVNIVLDDPLSTINILNVKAYQDLLNE